MPSRLVTFGIVVLWLGSSTWMFLREAWPRLSSDQPPRYVIDLSDEVGGNTVTWKVLQKGVRVGSGLSRVQRFADRTFELQSEFKFEELQLLKILEFRRLTSKYRVTADGKLVAVWFKIIVRTSDGKDNDLPLAATTELEFEGKVEDGKLVPRVLIAGVEQKLLPLSPIPLPENGGVLNPMHLLNKVPKLKLGQRWHVPLLDPLASGLTVQGATVTQLEAEVETRLLSWGGEEVPCWIIEYREPGKKTLSARTWVRRRDGLVLQQDAFHQLLEITLQREPPGKQ